MLDPLRTKLLKHNLSKTEAGQEGPSALMIGLVMAVEGAIGNLRPEPSLLCLVTVGLAT